MPATTRAAVPLIAALIATAASPSRTTHAGQQRPIPTTRAAAATMAPGPCRAGETAVVVDTRARRLHLCARGAVERTFEVALGSRGVGKRHTGDFRTPLGHYPLGAPRASGSFHRFVPVGYPTPQQARMGFTGSAIGIHGPPRGVEDLGAAGALVATDWTAGCIAVTRDTDIDAVSAWIRAREVKDVRLFW